MERIFYVDIIREGRVGLLAGPFPSEPIARKYEMPAYRKACEVDPWADFDPHGVVGVDPAVHCKPGRINHLIEIDPVDLVIVAGVQ